MSETNKKPLEIELIRYGELVLGKITHQDESLRGMGEFRASNGVMIRSIEIPQIEENLLFIRGMSTHKDDVIMNYYAYDPTNAMLMIKKINDAVEELCEVRKNGSNR